MAIIVEKRLFTTSPSALYYTLVFLVIFLRLAMPIGVADKLLVPNPIVPLTIHLVFTEVQGKSSVSRLHRFKKMSSFTGT